MAAPTQHESRTTAARSGTFVDNMKLPVHRWFRYSAGFSAEWVAELLRQQGPGLRVFDPFAGSATVVIEAEKAGAEGLGTEAHPFVARVAQAKLAWRADPAAFQAQAARILADARARRPAPRPSSALLDKCYTPEALARLRALQEALDAQREEGPAWELAWLSFIAIIRATSHVGTAQWQYVLPNKSKAKVLDPFLAYEEKQRQVLEDLRFMRRFAEQPAGQVLNSDARTAAGVPDAWADLVITSPPYANNYDYADATRLEMTLIGEIAGWGELQDKIRRHLVRSCTQHVAAEVPATDAVVASPLLAPIRAELAAVVLALESARHEHGGKKPYHTMIAAYCHDLAQVWRALRRVVRPGGQVCFVVGDSAPYGVHAPIERWLGELAVAAGFESFRFEKLRDRNTKWKNRKHQVPLHEGRLWVQG